MLCIEDDVEIKLGVMNFGGGAKDFFLSFLAIANITTPQQRKMSEIKDIERGEDAVTNTSADGDAQEEEELEKGLIRVVCSHLPLFIKPVL